MPLCSSQRAAAHAALNHDVPCFPKAAWILSKVALAMMTPAPTLSQARRQTCWTDQHHSSRRLSATTVRRLR